MRRFTSTVNASAGGTTYGKPFVVDTYSTPCNIGIGITVAGSAEYTVQHTFADPFTVTLAEPTAATWLNHETLVSGTSNDDSNYAFPPTAVRLAVHAATSAQVTMTLVQSTNIC